MNYIRQNAPAEYNISGISNGMVSNILTKSNIRLYKITYYEENKYPEHIIKDAVILHIYSGIKILMDKKEQKLEAILSYDEKLGIQAKSSGGGWEWWRGTLLAIM